MTGLIVLDQLSPDILSSESRCLRITFFNIHRTCPASLANFAYSEGCRIKTSSSLADYYSPLAGHLKSQSWIHLKKDGFFFFCIAFLFSVSRFEKYLLYNITRLNPKTLNKNALKKKRIFFMMQSNFLNTCNKPLFEVCQPTTILSSDIMCWSCTTDPSDQDQTGLDTACRQD